MDCRSCVGEMETSLEVAEPEIIDPKESRLLYVADPGEFHDSADMMNEGCVDEAEIEKEESSESSDSDQDDDPDDTGNMLDFLDPDEKIFADTLSDDSQSSYPNYDVECKFVEVNPKLNHEEGEEYEDQTCDDEYSENQSMSIQADECDDQDRPSENYLEADYEGATPDDQRISSARDVSKAVSEKSTPRTSSAGRKRKYYKSKKVYVCPICDHVFHSHSNRRAHMRVHTNERPFTCAHCDRRFVQKSALKVHIRIHTGEKPYSCSICNRQFSRKSCMNMHEMVHSNEKPFSCSLCDYACKYEAALRKHKRTHTGEKPYSCSVCQNTFTSRIGMREHERIHTGEQPYSCTLCPYRTSRYSSLRRHKECHYRRKFTKEEIEVMITDLGPE